MNWKFWERDTEKCDHVFSNWQPSGITKLKDGTVVYGQCRACTKCEFVEINLKEIK